MLGFFCRGPSGSSCDSAPAPGVGAVADDETPGSLAQPKTKMKHVDPPVGEKMGGAHVPQTEMWLRCALWGRRRLNKNACRFRSSMNDIFAHGIVCPHNPALHVEGGPALLHIRRQCLQRGHVMFTRVRLWCVHASVLTVDGRNIAPLESHPPYPTQSPLIAGNVPPAPSQINIEGPVCRQSGDLAWQDFFSQGVVLAMRPADPNIELGGGRGEKTQPVTT